MWSIRLAIIQLLLILIQVLFAQVNLSILQQVVHQRILISGQLQRAYLVHLQVRPSAIQRLQLAPTSSMCKLLMQMDV